MEILIKTIFQSIVLILIVMAYIKIVRFKDINIRFSNPHISTITALIAVALSIVMTILYNKCFVNIFPVNTTLNLLIVRLILDSPAIICMIINSEKINTVGLTRENILKSIFLGLFIGFIYFFTYSTKSFDVVKNINLKLINTLTSLFVYCSVIGLGEEFLYRGFLQTRLINISGKFNGWLLTSIIFALMHLSERIIINGYGIFQSIISCAYLLPISLLLGFISMKTKNLIPSTICHTFVDWSLFIFMSVK